jgi:hypothetical protein
LIVLLGRPVVPALAIANMRVRGLSVNMLSCGTEWR